MPRVGDVRVTGLGHAAGPNLGTVVDLPILGWQWYVDAIDGYGQVFPVAFSREQAEEMRRRLNEALGGKDAA